jgi:tetratricopeptide (TPR) repeat protein
MIVTQDKIMAGQDLAPHEENRVIVPFPIAYKTTAETAAEALVRLPRPLQEALTEIQRTLPIQPHDAIPRLLALIEQYPDRLLLYNYLQSAYHWADLPEKANEVIRKNYQNNPDYLPARLAYANLCLQEGAYEKIADIFDYTFDLRLLYPGQEEFHIAEVRNFMGLVGLYFVKTGQPEIAAIYYNQLKQIAPDFALTQELRRQLQPGLMERLLRFFG